MTELKELKPCKCGNNPVGMIGEGKVGLICEKCGYVIFRKSGKALIKAWNKRNA